MDSKEARQLLHEKFHLSLTDGYFLHVGGNDWYKNRKGVIELYIAWRRKYKTNIPLLMIGAKPSDDIRKTAEESSYTADIKFLSGVTDEYVRIAYSGAIALVFPSLAEGFGWPIAEAMACGCPVITTDEDPMNEVAGHAGFLISRRPFNDDEVLTWAERGAVIMQYVFELPDAERKNVVDGGLENARRFDTGNAMDKIEEIYRLIAGDVNQDRIAMADLVSNA
jgi:glycosyltransferase involved in cell wall biosynthesis